MKKNQHRLIELERDGRLPGRFSGVPSKGFKGATGDRAWRATCSCKWTEKAYTKKEVEERFHKHQAHAQRQSQSGRPQGTTKNPAAKI